MTPYRKNLLAWACIMALALGAGIAAQCISRWFIALFFAVIFSAHFVINKITCPNCGVAVTHVGEPPFAGFRIVAAFFRTECQNCGFDLDKSD